MFPDRSALVARLSREVALFCDATGAIRWLDERASDAFGDQTGKPFSALAVPGTESKAQALVFAAAAASVDNWELSVLLKGTLTTLAFRGVPCDDGALLVGSLVPEAYNRALTSVGEATREIAVLQRETASKHQELTGLYDKLRESNQGMMSLHAELDDRNDALRRNYDVKSRVVANVSHEFRTPINSILGLTQLLLDRLDGELNAEQEKQLRFIRTSAKSLSDLVNDLLDLSRLEAGRDRLRTSEFTLGELLSSIRGMMRPLFPNEGLELVVEDPAPAQVLQTDQGKVAQVLRNLVSNALKFTPRGEVRVGAEVLPDNKIAFYVSDTGIGIAPADQDRVFEEFVQIDGELQRLARGTGLGLPLSRRLAEVLGGSLTLKSTLGSGSTFTFVIPRIHEEVAEMRSIEQKAAKIDPTRAPVLVIEDDRQTMFLYERYLSSSGFQVIPARTVEDARLALTRVKPSSIVLDIMLEGEATWQFLSDLKDNPSTHDIPLMVVTVMDRAQHRARALGADEFWLKPVDRERLVRKLTELSRRSRVTKVLVVDDDDAARYLVRKLLVGTEYEVIDTADGPEAVRLARLHLPSVILLDFLLQGCTAFDVLDDLRSDPRTRTIPVIIQTSKQLDDGEKARLAQETSAILSKDGLSRELAITRIREALLAAGIAATTQHEGPEHD